MSTQELTVRLCQEGDRHLALDELPLATAFYLAAFSCHPPSVVQRAQQSLSQEQTERMVSVLEAWCRGEAQIPSIHWDGMAVVSLTVALAAAFLGALQPNNLAASLCRLTILTGQGRHEEVARRCEALLEGPAAGPLELRLMRALAWVLSGTKAGAGVTEYLQAFVTHAQQTLGFIFSHQQDHLPLLISACQDHLLEPSEAEAAGGGWGSDCQRFLAALAPSETQAASAQALSLLRTGRLEECMTTCSQALESASTAGKLQGTNQVFKLLTMKRESPSILLVTGAPPSPGPAELSRPRPPASNGQEMRIFLGRELDPGGPGDAETDPSNAVRLEDSSRRAELAPSSQPRFSGGPGQRELTSPHAAAAVRRQGPAWTPPPERPPTARCQLPLLRSTRPGRLGPISYSPFLRDACGVHQLAALLMELDPSEEISRLLSADALYQMGRVEDAHKTLLVALSKSPHTAPILARLALLQLRKGFFYDANLLIKKVIQIGDTSCLQQIMEIFREEDRKLLQTHCHSRAVTILKNKQGDTYTKEAIAYLSLAIIASGSQARESLLARARCYGHLGQKKTAIYDFNTILKTDPTNVQALCGRAFMHLVLNQQKEAVDSIISALTLDMAGVVPEILSLKQEAQVFITQGLYSHCRTGLNQLASDRNLPREEASEKLLSIGEALIKIDATKSSWRIFLVDILILTGCYEKALEHLQEVLGPTPRFEPAQARLGFLQLKKKELGAAIHNLEPLAGKDPKDLGFLLHLLDTKQRHSLSQAAAEEGNALGKDQCPEKALGYYTLAVLASNGNPRYLRLRATCLSHLQDFSRALRDLDKVIQKHTASDLQTQVEDFCSRGRMFLGLRDEASAVEEFIRAFQLSPSLALRSVSAQPGPKQLAQMFHVAGQHCLEEQRYEDSWKVIEYGLLLDENSSDLKKLRGRLKREISWGCSIH
ncbi:tetratricopeptide repeat protein 34 [Sarcophilus harrisii]|uniref:tetratricopeptide repeat protein 34 n=1 Tax=Sarcophilus harrisii TaxID=9305 RepID=UPI001302058A|nr:tetratricopeptide repeat protein 34 [Sarcophilus harrisii]